jgi:amino acid permease
MLKMSEELFTREEVMAGLPARRASTLLFLIESRTAHMVAKSRQAMERFLTEEAAKERDLAFLEAFALGRAPPLRPTIQHLERHAPQWAPLVPDSPRVRAAVAHLLSHKYKFTYQAVPGIRAALGLDEEAVQQAYHYLYREPLEAIYAPRVTATDRPRWARAALARWLESLPPFWTAFALTLTETVGAGILALPIALASIGPLAGAVLLVVLGLVNVLTIASMAEAVSRSGTIRYGHAFIGRMVADYLGNVGSLILTIAVAAICLMSLLSYYVGLATTLADATPVPAWVWTALLFLIGLYFLSRESLDSTVASALLVGGINIGLILILSLFAFAHVQQANLLYVNVPLVGDRPFDPSILRLVFGVILAAYFGHLSMGNCARVVLHRDPSARSLIWGSVAAQAAAMILYCIWVLAVNGAVVPQVLANESGTALIPLAARVGSIVHMLGSVYAVLGMGMASIHISLGLFNLVRERLPTRPQSIMMLPRRRGRLLFQQRRKAGRGLRIGLAYLGMEGHQPRFRLDVQVDGHTDRMETPVSDHWDETVLLDQLPSLRQLGIRLAFEVLDAGQESTRLRVTSPMSMTYEGEWDAFGLRMVDALTLPDSLRQVVNWMVRRGEVGLAEVAAFTGQDEGAARAMLEVLAEQGFVRERGGKYQVHFALRRGRQLPPDIWQALDKGAGKQGRRGDAETVSPSPPLPFLASLLTRLGQRGRFFLSASPLAIIFLLTEWLLLTGAESFSEPIGFAGVVAVSLFAGIFPALLLIASRRKGECVPETVYRFLGHRLLTTGIYLFFLTSIFLHGLVIWQGPVERAGTLLVGVLVLAVTVAMVCRGVFAPRLVVELREELSEEERTIFAVTASGQPTIADVRLAYPEGEQHRQAATGEVPTPSSLRYAVFRVPVGQARELKVWAHKVTLEGDSESLPALLEVHCGEKTARFDPKLSGGQVLMPLTGETCQLEITLPEPSAL